MDKIIIRHLSVDTVIGIHDWEKQQKQPVWFDLDIAFDCQTAAQSDDINDALDYFKVCTEVTAFVSQRQFELIETLAEQVAQLILQQFDCDKVKLILHKPNAIENTASVGVKITRKKSI